MNLKCPLCTRVVSVDDALAGKKATCPFCRQVFAVPGAVPVMAAPAPVKAAPAPRCAATSAAAVNARPLPVPPGVKAQPAPLPVPSPAGPRRPMQMPAFLKRIPVNQIPWQKVPWKRPDLYGAIAVGFGLVAFPLAVLFASEGFGIVLAILAVLLGGAGLAIHFVYRQPSPILSGIGLAAGIAVLFGLAQDLKRADLASRANSVSATLTEAEKAKKSADEEKKAADEEKKAAEKIRQDAIAEPLKLKKDAEEHEKKALDAEKAAEEMRDKAIVEPKKLIAEYEKKKADAEELKQQAEAKEKAALAKEKDVQKQLNDVKAEQETAKKLKAAAEDAQTKLDKALAVEKTKLQKEFDVEKAKLAKEKDEADAKFKKEKADVAKELKEAKDALDKAMTLQEKVDKAVKTLTSKLKSDDPGERLKAVNAIAELGTDAPNPAAFAIGEATVDMDKKLAQTALVTLGKIRPKFYVSLLELTKNTEFNSPGVNPVVAGAAKKIGELGKEAAATSPIFTEYLKKFLSLKAPKEGDLDTVGYLAAALGKVAPADTGALDALSKVAVYKIDMEGEGEEKLRQEARAALYQIGTTETASRKQITPLLVAGFKEKKADARKQICEWLAVYGPAAKDAAPELMKLAKDTDEGVKTAAAKALKAIQK